jgi:hypothetical protein
MGGISDHTSQCDGDPGPSSDSDAICRENEQIVQARGRN